jgi:hypothetical protein
MKHLNTILLFCCLFIASSVLANKELVIEACTEDNGEMVNTITCPNSGKVRTGNFCALGNMFYNGCSVDVPEYGKFFFNSCVIHDHCYHHEPSSNGKSKRDCDTKFLAHLETQCKNHPNRADCTRMAKRFYQAVALFGNSAWSCSDTQTNYPDEL